jgi:GNAT superfamily N-acetyltransferase
MLRIANESDFELVFSMSKKFAATLQHSELVENGKLSSLINAFLTEGNDQKIVLLYGDQGMLVAFLQPFTLGSAPMAVEFAWWVEPEARKSGAGKALAEAYEFWAKKMGAKLSTMACYDDQTAKFYEKNGYSLYERAYIKEL